MKKIRGRDFLLWLEKRRVELQSLPAARERILKLLPSNLGGERVAQISKTRRSEM